MTMAQDRNDTKTVDLEHTVLDRAIRAVRDFQSGKATVTFVKNAVKAIPAEDVAVLSLATRVAAKDLERLRN